MGLLSEQGVAVDSIYSRGGGDDLVLFVKPSVMQAATDVLLEFLGPDWTVVDGQPHSVIPQDWDIVINPTPEGAGDQEDR